MARDDRKYDDEYEDDEEYEDDDYYESDEDYPRRNPLKPFVIALIILMVLMAVIIGLLFMRLQTANDRVSELNDSLTATRTELNNLLLEKQQATPAPTPAPTEAPTPTPEPTPEATATPEPTPEPTATPEPLLKTTVSDADLGGVVRPEEDKWYDSARKGFVDETKAFMVALHWGPNMAWNENMAVKRDEPLELLAEQNGWILVRTADGKYGWGSGNLFRQATAAELQTSAAPANQG